MHYGRYGPEGQYSSCNLGSGMCKFGFIGDSAPHAVFLHVVVRLRMLRIMAGTALKIGYAAGFVFGAGFARDPAPRAVFPLFLGLEGQFYARLSVTIPQVQLLDEVVVPVVCTTNARSRCAVQWRTGSHCLTEKRYNFKW